MVKTQTQSKNEEKVNEKTVIKTWLTGQHSCTLIVPRHLAKYYGLDNPSHVIIEGIENGILLKKLKV